MEGPPACAAGRQDRPDGLGPPLVTGVPARPAPSMARWTSATPLGLPSHGTPARSQPASFQHAGSERPSRRHRRRAPPPLPAGAARPTWRRWSVGKSRQAAVAGLALCVAALIACAMATTTSGGRRWPGSRDRWRSPTARGQDCRGRPPCRTHASLPFARGVEARRPRRCSPRLEDRTSRRRRARSTPVRRADCRRVPQVAPATQGALP